jgi:hypothetical protein
MAQWKKILSEYAIKFFLIEYVNPYYQMQLSLYSASQKKVYWTLTLILANTTEDNF